MHRRSFRYLASLIAVTVIRAVSAEEPPQAAVRASLLTPNDQMVSLEQVEKLATGAKVTRSEQAEGFTRFTAEWPEVVVQINFKADYDHKTQNDGALGFVSRFPKEDRETPEAKKLAAFIPSVRQSYGVVLPRGYDEKGNASALLRDLAKHLDGYLISNSSFYDSRGFRVLGHPIDSPFLGRAGRNLYQLEPPVPTKDLLAGTWDLTFGMKQIEEGATVQMWMESVDVFGAEGSHQSKGSVEMEFTPADAEEGFSMSFDYENTGRWEEKDGKIVVHTGKVTTANHKAEIDELKEAVDEMAAEMSKTEEPDESWMIIRDRDLILFEESEQGITAQMKRKKAAEAPKAPEKAE
jgi:hypothetical protein